MWTTRIACLVLASAIVLTVGCSQSVEVTSTYGHGVRFSDNARSYAWAPGSSRTSGEGRPQNPTVDKLIREFVDVHLARNGYAKVSEGEKPDFWIDYAVGGSLRGDPNEWFGPVYKEGRLGISALDPATTKLIWKGSAATRLDDSAPPDVRRERLDRVIGRVIDKAPTAKQKP